MAVIHKTATVIPASLPEHSRVRLVRAVPAAGLGRGAEGTIVHVYDEGGYEVEFLRGHNRPAVLTLEPDDIEALADDQ